MEEKILEIIESKVGFAQSKLLREKLAQEIVDLFREFIEWKDKDLIEPLTNYNPLTFCHSIHQLFDYWLTNIKSKQP
jgi:hypothetical protein